MGIFGKRGGIETLGKWLNSPEAPRSERTLEGEGHKREKPDFAALAAQRREAVSQKMSSRWEGIKGFLKKARDFAFTIDKRAAYHGGVAKDVVVEKATALGHAAAETGKAVGREVKATAGQAKTWAVEGAKDMYRLGKSGVEKAWGGISRGVEAAYATYQSTAEFVGSKRQELMDSMEMRAYRQEQEKIAERNRKIQELMRANAMSEAVQAAITKKFQERMAAKGVNWEELGFEQETKAA